MPTSRPAVAALGHVGLRCFDLAAQVAFYTTVLGLQVTDRDDDLGLCFLSARPEEEHHELLLAAGRDVAVEGKLLQQLSFRCAALDDVLAFLERFEAGAVPLDMVVSHGNAIGVYFFDPEGNRCEVYWPTGLATRQPYVWHLDLHRDLADVLADVRSHAAEHAAGFTAADYVARTVEQARPTRQRR